MWQIILGVYLVLSILCGKIFWTSLMLAKETDHRMTNHLLLERPTFGQLESTDS